MRSVALAAAALALGGSALGGDSVSDSVVIGDVRIQALSPTLLRVEPRGPMGFEDRTTFVVKGRNFEGIPIKQTGPGIATTDHYTVAIQQHALPNATCANSLSETDVAQATRTLSYQDGARVGNEAECCSLCTEDAQCAAYVYADALIGTNCYPLSGFVGTKSARNRHLGCVRGCSGLEQITVSSPTGEVLYQAASPASPFLHWPGPLEQKAVVFTDRPRFHVPEWGPQPIPAGEKVDPALVDTNGYDFRNNVEGDTYIFLLGNALQGWSASRKEFLQLTGNIPVLPDFAWGTWFTFWHQYTEDEAKSDIARWEVDDLPIDVWALDMNWRYTDHDKDHFYTNPNTKLLPDLANGSTAWFDYLKSKNLYTYFNDHPYPVDQQTAPREVAFRWEGLTSWLERGLTYWWFDHNWKFSIPPPFTKVANNKTSGVWDGLDNAVWGSHIYHETVARFNKLHRPDAPPAITLTKTFLPDARPWDKEKGYAENPAHHRYPVWWTGDEVVLDSSVMTMVDQGVHAVKPYVHSDCGGDIPRFVTTKGGMMRWIGHCALGTILRIHGTLFADHRPWTYGNETEAVVRKYLHLRYRLIPSFIAAGKEAETTGTPLVARCDLFWPEYSSARSNTQYIHLGETLVAPIVNTEINMSSRSVWVPPGDWQDGWTGEIVKGPQNITVSKPFEQIPMWHRRGGFVVIDSKVRTRVNVSAWDELTLEAFPDAAETTTTKYVYEGALGSATSVSMSTTSEGDVNFTISPGPRERGWVVRLHLRPAQSVSGAVVDGQTLSPTVLMPSGGAIFPFSGEGAQPAAGSVAEFRLPASARQQLFSVSLQ